VQVIVRKLLKRKLHFNLPWIKSKSIMMDC